MGRAAADPAGIREAAAGGGGDAAEGGAAEGARAACRALAAASQHPQPSATACSDNRGMDCGMHLYTYLNILLAGIFIDTLCP